MKLKDLLNLITNTYLTVAVYYGEVEEEEIFTDDAINTSYSGIKEKYLEYQVDNFEIGENQISVWLS